MSDKPRIAYDTNESYQDHDTGMFAIAKIEENEPGYWRLPTLYPTLQDAQAEVNRLNDELGLHPGDVLDICASSMAAHNAAKYGEPQEPRIEVLHVREPDAACTVRIWINGVEATNFYSVDVDPLRGHTAEQWDENHRDAIAAPELSEPYRAAVDQAYAVEEP